MTWSYTGDPTSSSKDEVRFLVADTDSADQLVQDEEIAYALGVEPTTMAAAARIARAIALKFARQADMSVGDLSYSYKSRAEQYFAMVKDLEEQATMFAVKPYAGGISVSDKTTQENDTDRVPPAFTKGMHDYVRTTEEDTGNDSE